jgi:hypothetical protein
MVGDIPSERLIRLNRLDLRRVAGILTGHCTLNEHMYRMGLRNDPMCPCGLDRESAGHFLCVCPRFSALRIRVFGRDELRKEEVRLVKIADILRYIKGTGQQEA